MTAGRVEQLHLNDDQPTDSSLPVSSTPDDSLTNRHPTPTEQPGEGQPSAEEQRVINNFKQWFDNNGPQSDDASTILLDAAQVLDEQGSLEASELRKQLYERNPGAYCLCIIIRVTGSVEILLWKRIPSWKPL